MTTPTGTISLNNVNTELGRPGTQSINMNDSAVRNLAGVASGAISLYSLRGKTAYIGMTVNSTDDQRSYSSFSGGGVANSYPSVSVSGGSGGYTYSWSFTSNPNGASLNDATLAQCRVSKTFVKTSTGSYSAILQCVVTDNTGHSVTKTGINAGADWEGM